MRSAEDHRQKSEACSSMFGGAAAHLMFSESHVFNIGDAAKNLSQYEEGGRVRQVKVSAVMLNASATEISNRTVLRYPHSSRTKHWLIQSRIQNLCIGTLLNSTIPQSCTCSGMRCIPSSRKYVHLLCASGATSLSPSSCCLIKHGRTPKPRCNDDVRLLKAELPEGSSVDENLLKSFCHQVRI